MKLKIQGPKESTKPNNQGREHIQQPLKPSLSPGRLRSSCVCCANLIGHGLLLQLLTFGRMHWLIDPMLLQFTVNRLREI